MSKSKTNNKTNNIPTITPEEQERQEYIRFALDSVSAKIYDSAKTKVTTMTVENVRQLLTDPVKNYQALQGISQALEMKQGIYHRFIQYWSSLLTYDHFLYPLEVDNSADKMIKNYEKSALQLDKLNIKYHFPYFQYKRMVNGEIFVYKLEDSKGVVYKEIPNFLCKVTQMEDGVFRYSIDLSKFTDTTILDYPAEFQSLYNSYKINKNKNKGGNSKSKDKQNLTAEDSNWALVSEKGICFPTRYDSQHSYPPLCYLFPDLMEIEGIKELQLEFDTNNNIKIAHSKIPINKDTGLPVMDKTIVDSYNKSLKKHLPEGYVSIVNPFDTDIISLKGTQSEQRNLITEAIDRIYQNSGISDLLFANKKASSEALKKSIETDLQLLYSHTLPLFANYVNYEIKKNKFKAVFPELSYFDREEKLKNYISTMPIGASRLKYLAMQGLNPLQALNILKFEQAIGIDDILVSKSTSYTQSGSESAGRPVASETEVTENTIKSRDQQ